MWSVSLLYKMVQIRKIKPYFMKEENLVGVFDMKRGYVTAVYQYWPHPDDIYSLGSTLDPRGHQPVNTRL